MSSTSTVQSHRHSGSIGSMDSLRSGDPFSRSPRVTRSQHLEEIPEGPSQFILLFILQSIYSYQMSSYGTIQVLLFLEI